MKCKHERNFGERKKVNLEDIVDLDAQTKANNEAMRKVIDFIAGERKRAVKLKPCPFCGAPAHIHEHERFGVECDECGMGLACIKETAEEAAEAWNKRVNDD